MGERRGTKALELWCKKMTEGYPGVKVENMTTSWRDGLAFCAIIHHFKPELIDFSKLNKDDIFYNNELAFTVAEKYLGIPALLEPEDMVEYDVPDRLSILTYLSQFYKTFVASQDASSARIVPKRPANTSERAGSTSPASTSPPAKMAIRSSAGLPRREPCARCGNPVYIAERLTVGKSLYHRTCFRCARCNSQLTLANCYETETPNQFCCETCPDEEKNKKTTQTTEKSVLSRSLSDEEKSASLKLTDDYSADFETALEGASVLGTAEYTQARSRFLAENLDFSDSEVAATPELPRTKPPELPRSQPPPIEDTLSDSFYRATHKDDSIEVTRSDTKPPDRPKDYTVRNKSVTKETKNVGSDNTSLVRNRMKLFEKPVNKERPVTDNFTILFESRQSEKIKRPLTEDLSPEKKVQRPVRKISKELTEKQEKSLNLLLKKQIALKEGKISPKSVMEGAKEDEDVRKSPESSRVGFPLPKSKSEQIQIGKPSLISPSEKMGGLKISPEGDKYKRQKSLEDAKFAVKTSEMSLNEKIENNAKVSPERDKPRKQNSLEDVIKFTAKTSAVSKPMNSHEKVPDRDKLKKQKSLENIKFAARTSPEMSKSLNSKISNPEISQDKFKRQKSLENISKFTTGTFLGSSWKDRGESTRHPILNKSYLYRRAASVGKLNHEDVTGSRPKSSTSENKLSSLSNSETKPQNLHKKTETSSQNSVSALGDSFECVVVESRPSPEDKSPVCVERELEIEDNDIQKSVSETSPTDGASQHGEVLRDGPVILDRSESEDPIVIHLTETSRNSVKDEVITISDDSVKESSDTSFASPHRETSNYPEDLNPFGEEDVKANLNPFEEDEDEEERPPKPTPAARKKISLGHLDSSHDGDTPEDFMKVRIQRISVNPFEEDEKKENKLKVDSMDLMDLPKRVIHAPKISLNPFWSDDDDEEAVSEEDENKLRPVPKPRKIRTGGLDSVPTPDATPRKSKQHSLGGAHFGSTSSLSSCQSDGQSTRKKKPAPRPPLPFSEFKNDSDKESLTSSPSASISHSPRLRSRKIRKAPLPPTSTPLLNELSTPDENPSDLSPIQANVIDTSKQTKDKVNENRRSQLFDAVDLEEYVPNKSTYGKWKRKKGPAPSRPVPQRRLIKDLPVSEFRKELDLIELQKQGLEKQGVRLEQIIRDRCEGPDRDPSISLDEDTVPIDVEDLILQLFEVVNEKNELSRREAELMYLQRQQRLEEEHAEIEYQIRCLMMQPEVNKTDSDKAKEEELIQRLVEIVERRNEIVECLEMDRVREAEEDDSINSSLNSYASRRDEQDPKEIEEPKDSQKTLSKKEKLKKKKDKKKKKDADKDVDESETATSSKEKKKKKFAIF